MEKNIFVNRTLNLKKIKYIGFDMDHTLVRYRGEHFEALAHKSIIDRMVLTRQYPEEIRDFKFDFKLAIRGLAVDRQHGNLLKVSRHSAIRASSHGTQPIPFADQQQFYKSTYIELSDPNYSAIDTTFSISYATLFAQLVDYKDQNPLAQLPDYSQIADDVLNCLDEVHRDGSLKSAVLENIGEYVIQDESVVRGLEKYRKHGKHLFLLTNSDFHYTKALLDYALKPFLSNEKDWSTLFDIVIVDAMKPRFFFDNLNFLKINPKDGTMTNLHEKISHGGIYYSGCAKTFTNDLGVAGDDILYVGDHIYGDILRLKKDCNWRTALVIEELGDEVASSRMAKPINEKIEYLMDQKVPLEEKMVEMISAKIENHVAYPEEKYKKLQMQVSELDQQISELIIQQQGFYNKNWGRIMRAGNEESYFANQVERFACVYMPRLSDLFACSPRTYFRAFRRTLPHEEFRAVDE
jgi:HAD superfamily 5'-nucleotidase-like hydrolase